MRRISIGTLIISLLIPLIVGGASSAISSKAMLAYGTMDKPPLSPPAWVFSVVWTILYIMMGLALYFIIMSGDESANTTIALILYGVQLAMNFMWSYIFFNKGMYLAAFIWLLIMWIVVIVCVFKICSISKVATYMFIPYILWIAFAAYLNFGAYVLNSSNK